MINKEFVQRSSYRRSHVLRMVYCTLQPYSLCSKLYQRGTFFNTYIKVVSKWLQIKTISNFNSIGNHPKIVIISWEHAFFDCWQQVHISWKWTFPPRLRNYPENGRIMLPIYNTSESDHFMCAMNSKIRTWTYIRQVITQVYTHTLNMSTKATHDMSLQYKIQLNRL